MKKLYIGLFIIILSSCGKIPAPSILSPSPNMNLQKVNFGEPPSNYKKTLKDYLINNHSGELDELNSLIIKTTNNDKNNLRKLKLSFDKKILITEPLEYLDFLKLMKDARIILSDSGGLQEEAAIMGTPCITLRTTTERQITVIKKVNILAGYSKKKIVSSVNNFFNKKISKIKDFGSGNVTDKIYNKLKLNNK